jgi:hypothetical protein
MSENPALVPDDFWPGRIGLPSPITPPPVTFGTFEGTTPAGWDELYESIVEICFNCGVVFDGMVEVSLTSRWNRYIKDSAKQDTILIGAKWSQASRDSWTRAVQIIMEALNEKGLDRLSVEINDSRKALRAFHYPALAAGSSIEGSWENGSDPLEPKVLKVLEPMLWHTLSVAGQKHDPKEPAIFLTVWNPRDTAWNSVRERIQALCDGFTPGPIEVVITQAYDIRMTKDDHPDGDEKGKDNNNDATAKTRGMNEFNEIGFGGSVEVKDQKNVGVGTIGGFFKLKRDNAPSIRVALTCYHVVRAPSLVAAGMCHDGLDDLMHSFN